MYSRLVLNVNDGIVLQMLVRSIMIFLIFVELIDVIGFI